LQISAGNTPPAASIVLPTAGTTYKGGDTIQFSGTASDLQDGANLPASAFTWEVRFHHNIHYHPFMPPTSGIKSGSFVVPKNNEVAAGVWYRILLTVTDSGGLSTTIQRDVLPQTSQFTVQTVPAGLEILLDAQPRTAPQTITGVVGIVRTIGVN